MNYNELEWIAMYNFMICNTPIVDQTFIIPAFHKCLLTVYYNCNLQGVVHKILQM